VETAARRPHISPASAPARRHHHRRPQTATARSRRRTHKHRHHWHATAAHANSCINQSILGAQGSKMGRPLAHRRVAGHICTWYFNAVPDRMFAGVPFAPDGDVTEPGSCQVEVASVAYSPSDAQSNSRVVGLRGHADIGTTATHASSATIEPHTHIHIHTHTHIHTYTHIHMHTHTHK
jgi:hypothetical protein